MKFFVTFGQKYRQEPHPQGGHPDGWFEVEASCEGEARAKVFEKMGSQWGFIYAEGEFDQSYFPLGRLKEI